MNQHRFGQATATLAGALLTVAASGALAWTARAAAKRRDGFLWRFSTGGCTPYTSPYVNGRVCLHDIDGTHEGYALSMLWDRLCPAPANEVPDTLAELERAAGPWSDEHAYDDALRSCVEVAINLALNLAEESFESECDDDECGGACGVDYEMLHLVAAQRMTEFAVSFEANGRDHATSCLQCATAGVHAPAMLCAQFCRDISDDLLTNMNSEQTVLTGVPVPVALDVLDSIVQVIEQGYGVSSEDTLTRMKRGLAAAIGRKEAHAAQQS